MRILVLDWYESKRDRTPLDMYKLLEERHEVIYAGKDNILDYVVVGNYDLLYLGVYHHVMTVEYPAVFALNTKPVLIDQSDNEEFITVDNDYSLIDQKKLLSRYLPHPIEEYWKGETCLLPRFIDINRYKVLPKTIDVAFVCSIYGFRLGTDRPTLKAKLDKLLTNTNLTYITAEVWDTCYFDILARSKALIIDGSRYCMTSKYLEAALCECVIIGETPTIPTNEFKTTECDYESIEPILEAIESRANVEHNKEYVLRTYASKDYFFKAFDAICEF